MLVDLNKELLEFRKSGNTVGKNLLSTLKGAVELETSKPENKDFTYVQIINKLAKKMYKGIKEVNNEDSLEELNILTKYLPIELDEKAVLELLNTMNLEKLPNFGAKMGVAMKQLKGKVNGDVVKKVLLNNFS